MMHPILIAASARLIERNRWRFDFAKVCGVATRKRHLVFPPDGNKTRVIDIVQKGSIAFGCTAAFRARGAPFDGGAHVVG